VSGESIFFTSNDGLRLHARCYGGRESTAIPVVCLPGLTRTAADFEVLAERLSAAGRRVIALDYRGRGLSAYDPNPANYNVKVELGDVLTVLDALNAQSAIFIGTSRGGIVTMMLAGIRPQAIAAAILNDIGPVIELPGLLRIKSYVGKLPAPENYAHAAGILRGLFAAQFPNLSDEDWLASARRAFKQDNGRLVPTYDVTIAETLKDIGPETEVPDLWPQFDAWAQAPLMVIRGALSDLLSAETVAAMKARHPDIRVVEVADQGHAPMLEDEPTLAAVERFVNVIANEAKQSSISR
jgi:pimeloyl-ACP methyl ester carboxylesterase